jgi:hypothetical protein
MLTLLVAVCEQAIFELEAVIPRPKLLIEHLKRTRDEAIDVGRALSRPAAAA